ncbi:hypothetical protein [Streptomyces sp. NPDC005423]|uniref:hypothetical protein n=1 Tax=Streptomyces sp. NPDC005423 TaxID=3155343 RepID=UPI0033B9D524
MSVQAHRAPLRLLVALAVTLALPALTGCEDGEGVRDEGPAGTHAPAVPAGHGSTPHSSTGRGTTKPPGR